MIPLSSPKASYLAQREAITEAVKQVLESGHYILDSTVENFEQEFASYLGLKAAAGVGNGTDALVLCLRALDVKPDERVVTVSHTAVATVAAIEMAGAIPVLVDVDANSFCMRADALADTLTDLRKRNQPIGAVILVHLYGQAGELEEIANICREFDVPLIEDCAQAHGALHCGRKLGNFGELAAFSFYPTKNLGALGDGGAIASNNQALLEKIKALRQYGWQKDRISQMPGVNSRLDPLQAAVLRVKLKQLDADNANRQAIAALYNQNLKGLVQTPVPSPKVSHVYHLYVIKTSRRESLQDYLAQQQIGTGIHYPLPVHLQPAYLNRIELSAAGLTNTEEICPTILSLPMFPELAQSEASKVCAAINEWGLRAG